MTEFPCPTCDTFPFDTAEELADHQCKRFRTKANGFGGTTTIREQAATEKQVALLQRMGWGGDPTRLTKTEASDVIDEFIKKADAEKAQQAIRNDDDVAAEIRACFTDRKLDVADVTPSLHVYAEAWLRGQHNLTFDFLIEMRSTLISKGKLTVGQAKGVLNCIRAQVLREAKQTATPKTDEVTEGMWRIGDRIFKVRVAVHGSGNLYALEYKPFEDWSFETHGKKKGEFDYVKGGMYLLKTRGATRMTMEEAKEWGALYGACCVCATTLTNEKSIEAGIGPVCAGKL